MNKNSDLMDYNSIESYAKQKKEEPKKLIQSSVENPSHYGGADDSYEAIKVIEAWNLNFNLGNTLKYIKRDGKAENIHERITDLLKAKWYLEREIMNLEKKV